MISKFSSWEMDESIQGPSFTVLPFFFFLAFVAVYPASPIGNWIISVTFSVLAMLLFFTWIVTAFQVSE